MVDVHRGKLLYIGGRAYTTTRELTSDEKAYVQESVEQAEKNIEAQSACVREYHPTHREPFVGCWGEEKALEAGILPAEMLAGMSPRSIEDAVGNAANKEAAIRDKALSHSIRDTAERKWGPVVGRGNCAGYVAANHRECSDRHKKVANNFRDKLDKYYDQFK